ncbi:hypothetical protein HK405_015430, partial [Cladochytrium tenue]
MRFGQIPCRLLNTLYPDTVTKLHDARSTFAALENLAAYSAGLALRGIERKALFRPLEFANGTPRGDEMFVRNLVRLAIIASEDTAVVGAPKIDSADAWDALREVEKTAPPTPTALKFQRSESSAVSLQSPVAAAGYLLAPSNESIMEATRVSLVGSMTANAEAQERLMREALDRVTGALQRLERRVTAMEATLRDAVSDGLAPRGDVGGGRQLPAAGMPKLKISGSAGSVVVDTAGDWADGPAGWGGSDDVVFESPVNGRRSVSKSRRKSVQEQAAFLAAAGQGSGGAGTGGMAGGVSTSALSVLGAARRGGADFGTAAVSSPSLFPGDEGKAVSPRSQFPRLPEAVACSGLPKKELM